MAAPEIGTVPGDLDLKLRQGLTTTFRQYWVSRKSIRDRGGWTATTAYLKDDVVLKDGVAWVALRDNVGVLPVIGADWELNETPLDLSDYVIRVAIAQADGQGLPIFPALLAFSSTLPSPLGSTATLVTPTLGVTDIKITDEDSALLPVMLARVLANGSVSDKRGIWDEELEHPAGDVSLALQGRVTVRPQVSQ